MYPWSSTKMEPIQAPSLPTHPYYPPSLAISPYLANTFGTLELVAAFAAGCVVILGSTALLVRQYNRKAPLSTWDLSCVLWFVLCGCIHLFFEGYFVANHTRMPAMGDFFGQLWKEYSLSDSRYMFSDPFVLCMESITAILWGPLSFLTAYLIATSSPWRHPVQALVSTGQFYGDLLYYTTSLFDDFYLGKKYYRPEPYYFWVYFIFMNVFWLIMPAVCLGSSMKISAKALKGASKASLNGSAKKTL